MSISLRQISLAIFLCAFPAAALAEDCAQISVDPGNWSNVTDSQRTKLEDQAKEVYGKCVTFVPDEAGASTQALTKKLKFKDAAECKKWCETAGPTLSVGCAGIVGGASGGLGALLCPIVGAGLTLACNRDCDKDYPAAKKKKKKK